MKVNEQVIVKLFWVMRNQYGSRWIMIFSNGEQIEAGKADWLDKLKPFNANDIAKTLEHVKEIYPGNPPDSTQFVKLLKHLKGSRPGHLSNHTWKSRTMEKTTASGFRQRIKEEFGV